jgi:hypothetical protein
MDIFSMRFFHKAHFQSGQSLIAVLRMPTLFVLDPFIPQKSFIIISQKV